MVDDDIRQCLDPFAMQGVDQGGQLGLGTIFGVEIVELLGQIALQRTGEGGGSRTMLNPALAISSALAESWLYQVAEAKPRSIGTLAA